MINLSELQIGMKVMSKGPTGVWSASIIRNVSTKCLRIPIISVDVTFSDGVTTKGLPRTLDELKKL